MLVDKPIDLLLVGQLLAAVSLLGVGICFLWMWRQSDSDRFPPVGFAWFAWGVLAISIMSFAFTFTAAGQEKRRIEDERGKINCLANLEFLKSKGRDTSGMRCE